MVRLILFSLIGLTSVSAQTQELELQPGGWVDTGIDLKPGDALHITATGQLQYSTAAQANGPEGLPRGFADLLRVMQVNDSGRGAVIGRIGSDAADRPFVIGAEHRAKAFVGGRLFVAVNQASSDEATGSYHVRIEVTPRSGPAPAPARAPDFPQKLLDSIPLRVSDPAGAPGDRVNFILIGSQQQVQDALKAAGWVVVDRSVKETILKGFLASVSKEAYVTMPMSELRLFDRPQDFGYAQADPLRVVASRHHFRIWKAPFEFQGQTVWAGAGTHDIGFDRDRRNNGITHKIDADTDHERDFIRENLTQTGLVTATSYMTPTNPVLKAKTATGDEFSSDGRTLLVFLAPAPAGSPANQNNRF